MEHQMVLLPIRLDELINQLTTSISEKVVTSLSDKKNQERSEQLISPSEVCKMFTPAISRQTVANWEKKGLLEKRTIGGKVYFLHGQILEAAKSLKKYKRG